MSTISPARTAQIDGLILTLTAAQEAADRAGDANPEDGGTCNFDGVMIRLYRWPSAAVDTYNRTARVTGTPQIGGQWSGYWKGYRPVNFRLKGQAARRTRMAEAAYKHLKALAPALDIRFYSQAD